MNEHERRLADLLRQGTPQPPATLDPDELMREQPRVRTGFRFWPQLAAAAAVVVLAGGIAAVAATNHGSGRHDRSGGGIPTSGPTGTVHGHCQLDLSVAARHYVMYAHGRVGESQAISFANASGSSCTIENLVARLGGQRRRTGTDPVLFAPGTTTIRPGDIASTTLSWTRDPRATARSFTLVEFLNPAAHPITVDPINAGQYPKGSPKAGRVTVAFSPLRLSGRIAHIGRSSSSSPSGTTGRTTDVPVTTVPAPPAGSPSSPSGSGTIKECVLGMKPSLGTVTSHGTQRSARLYFRNVSGKTCSTYAAPGLLALPAHSRNGIMVGLVDSGYRHGVLAPGHSAYSTLVWTDDPSRPSRPTTRYTTLQVLYPLVKYAKEIDLAASLDISENARGNVVITCTGLRPVSG